MKYAEIEPKLRKVLSHKRYEHTLGVSFTASALAMKYGYDIDKARLAGLLHDCAKYVKDEKLIQICRKNNIEISDVELKSPYLLHGRVGAIFAQKKYMVEDNDVLNAIIYHTTGRPNMSILEKIIFIADYIEPQRNQIPGLEKIRKLAFEDMDLCIIEILKNTIDYLKNNNKDIDHTAEETLEFYCREKN